MEENKPQPIEIHTGIGSFRAMILSPDSQIVGEVTNEEELYDVLVQIKERNLSGYYGYRMMEDGTNTKFKLLPTGRVEDFGNTFVKECLEKLFDLDK